MVQNEKKKVSRRKVLKAAFAAGGAALIGLPAVRRAAAQQTIALKMQSTWPTKDIFHEIFVAWGKKVEEMAGGRLKIDILPSGAVVPAFQLIDAIHTGNSGRGSRRGRVLVRQERGHEPLRHRPGVRL